MKAINQMAAIYAGAAEAFVLDSMLQRIRLDSSSSAEILGQVLSCPWMGRCWTLQERALGQTLLLQYSDAAIWRGELDYETDPKRKVSLYLAARHRSLFSMFDWMENSGLPYTDQFELDGSTTTRLVAKLKERFGWPRSVPQLHLSPREIYEQRISLAHEPRQSRDLDSSDYTPVLRHQRSVSVSAVQK